MSQHHVLLIQEPFLSLQRVVQVNGLPFTIGSEADAAVRLRTPGLPCVRVEAADSECRVVDLGKGSLTLKGERRTELALRHGSIFQIADVTVRFFVGTAESLRNLAAHCASTSPPAPVDLDLHASKPTSDGLLRRSAVAYLELLSNLERKLAGIKPLSHI